MKKWNTVESFLAGDDGPDAVYDLWQSVLQGWGWFVGDGVGVLDFDSENFDLLGDWQAEFFAECDHFADAEEMWGRYRNKFEVGAVEFVDEAGRGLAGLDGVDDDEVFVADDIVEKGEAHFAGFADIDVVFCSGAFPYFAGDEQANGIVTQNIVT
jgi:hypothetical protein